MSGNTGGSAGAEQSAAMRGLARGGCGGVRDSMKFSNGDDSLDVLVKGNGGRVCLSNTDLLMEVAQDPTWK